MGQVEIIQEVIEERKRQNEKWGIQNHTPMEWIPVLTEEVGEVSKSALETYFGHVPYDNYDHYREELIHTAAVAIQAIESLDRQGR